MDPLTASGTFATIVSLLCNFRAERSQKDSVEFEDFMKWLIDKNSGEIKESIEVNTRLGIGIKSLLNLHIKEFNERMDGLDHVMSMFSSKINGLGDIALAINPKAEISEQAIQILSELNKSGASSFLESKFIGGVKYSFLEKGGGFVPTDPRFLEDDFKTLINLNLLLLDFNQNGGRIFRITRQSIIFLKAIGRA